MTWFIALIRPKRCSACFVCVWPKLRDFLRLFVLFLHPRKKAEKLCLTFKNPPQKSGLSFTISRPVVKFKCWQQPLENILRWTEMKNPIVEKQPQSWVEENSFFVLQLYFIRFTIKNSWVFHEKPQLEVGNKKIRFRRYHCWKISGEINVSTSQLKWKARNGGNWKEENA